MDNRPGWFFYERMRMNSFSLLTTPWLPVRFKDGTTGKLAPVDLADENVVDIAAPRADLQGAAWQFLLGLLQTSFAPKNHGRWDDIWQDGLEAEATEALLSLEHAFQFGADLPFHLCRISRRSREIKFRSLRYCLRFPALKQRSLIKTTLLSVA